jgi:hypothetical protein
MAAFTVSDIFNDNVDLAAFKRNRVRGCRTWKKAAQRFARYKADRKRTQRIVTDEDAYAHSRNEAIKQAVRLDSSANDADDTNTHTIPPPFAISAPPLVPVEAIAKLQEENARLKQELAALHLASPPSRASSVASPSLRALPVPPVPPVSVFTTCLLSRTGEIGNLEHLYENLIVNRLQYFSGTDENSTDKPRFIGNYSVCTAPFLVFRVVQLGRSSIRSEIRTNGTTRRIVTRIESGIETAVQNRKRYVWFPIKLCRSQ